MADVFPTNLTPLAAYLILSGFPLIEITYQPKTNGRMQGTFTFTDSPELRKHTNLFDTSQAIVNLANFEKMKERLIDKVMAGEEW